jgi:hypothetical protein
MTFLRTPGEYLNSRRSWLRLGAVVLTFVVIAHVLVLTLHDIKIYPGVDLRAKIVGARSILRGMNPYYDYRHEVLPDHLRMLQADTYSPVLLLFYAPLCELGWKAQRAVYFSIDWVALLLCYAMLTRAFPEHASRSALWIGFVLLFVADFGFRFHLERGQYYLEVALLTSLVAIALLRRSDSWSGALALALLVLVRPTYVICVAGVVFLRRFRHATKAVVLCGVLFAASLPIVGVKVWKDYFATVRAKEREMLTDAYAQGSQPAAASSTKVLEGVDFSKSLSGPGYLADRTLIGVARSSVSPALARFVHRVAPSERSLQRLNALCLLLALCFDLAVMYCLAHGKGSELLSVAFVLLAPLNLELFAPQHFGYCDVMICVPLLLMMAAYLEKGNLGGWTFYAAILLVGAGIPWLSFHFDKHVPLVSFSKYVVILVVLDGVCLKEGWKLRHRLRNGGSEPTIEMNGDVPSLGYPRT